MMKEKIEVKVWDKEKKRVTDSYLLVDKELAEKMFYMPYVVKVAWALDQEAKENDSKN